MNPRQHLVAVTLLDIQWTRRRGKRVGKVIKITNLINNDLCITLSDVWSCMPQLRVLVSKTLIKTYFTADFQNCPPFTEIITSAVLSNFLSTSWVKKFGVIPNCSYKLIQIKDNDVRNVRNSNIYTIISNSRVRKEIQFN